MIDPQELKLDTEDARCFEPEADAERTLFEDCGEFGKSFPVELDVMRPKNPEPPSGENSILSCDRRGLIKDVILLALGTWALGERVWSAELHQPSTPTEPVTMIVPLRSVGAEAIAFARQRSFGLPITGVSIPSLRASSLPNALRLYRRGIHQGFDLYCAFGTDVRAISDGIVTRADNGVTELSPELHRHLLSTCSVLNTTPSDILRRLTGRCVELDHGTREGTRVRSVYGHLSFLCVTEGDLVRRGDSLGAVGNSGTIAGVRGSREDAHLHLEIWVHRVGSPEVYLGEGMEEQHLRLLLQEIFRCG